MNSNNRVCLVLYPHVTRSDFERAAMEIGFAKHDTRPGDGLRSAYEEVWATQDRSTAVNYLEDPLVNLRYISLRGADVREFVTAFARRIEVYDGEDALELAVGAVNHNTQVEALARLAVTFPEYEPRAYEVFEAFATKAPNPILREAAVNTMVYRAWPEFLPLLERIAQDDPAENVRKRAQEIIPVVRQAHSGGAS